MMADLCVGCEKEVRARQEAVQCDGCDKWCHRKCGTDTDKRFVQTNG